MAAAAGCMLGWAVSARPSFEAAAASGRVRVERGAVRSVRGFLAADACQEPGADRVVGLPPILGAGRRGGTQLPAPLAGRARDGASLRVGLRLGGGVPAVGRRLTRRTENFKLHLALDLLQSVGDRPGSRRRPARPGVTRHLEAYGGGRRIAATVTGGAGALRRDPGLWPARPLAGCPDMVVQSR